MYMYDRLSSRALLLLSMLMMAGLLSMLRRRWNKTKKEQEPDKRAPDEIYRIVIAGDHVNGKTSLIKCFVGEKFDPSEGPTWCIPEFNVRTLDLDGVKIKLIVWGLGVLGRTGTTTLKLHQVHADGVIILYHVGRKTTFDNVPYWIEDAKKFGPPDVKLMVVGTGCDGETVYNKAVDYATAKGLADEHQLPFFEVSAKHGTNVELAFMTLIQEIRQSRTKPTAN